MSGLLAGKVWHSALEAHLKPLAAALADEARDDGTEIHPSLDLVAWKLSASRRAVQVNMKALREKGVLRAVCHAECQVTPGAAHGRGQPVHYVLAEDALPRRAPWSEERERLVQLRNGAEKHEESAPFLDEKDAGPAPFGDQKGAVETEKGATDTAKGCSPTSGDPYSVDPSEIYDPKEKNPPPQRALRPVEPPREVHSSPTGPSEVLDRVFGELDLLTVELCGWLAPSTAVSEQLLDWARDLELADVARIRTECLQVIEADGGGRRGNAWRLIVTIAGRVAVDRKAKRDPWAERIPRRGRDFGRQAVVVEEPLPVEVVEVPDAATTEGWLRVREELRGHLSPPNWATWIEPIEIALIQTQPVMVVPSDFVGQWLSKRLLPLVTRLCADAGIGAPRIVVAAAREAAEAPS